MKNLKAVASASLNGRFVLTDRATGETVDNNQGYGYKTPQKAYACFGWKTKNVQQTA